MVQLNELMGNRSLAILINFFISNSDTEFPQIKIKNKTKLAKATLTKWLDKLEKENFIEVKKEGVSKLYKLKKDNLIIKYLKIINTILKLNKIKSINKKYSIKTYLYGSAARGEDTKESDIDLLILGKIRKEDIIQDINNLSEKIGKKIKMEIFSLLEWSKIERKDRAFYERVEKDKIEL